jgi:AmiR/NasT family two-component response regulator
MFAAQTALVLMNAQAYWDSHSLDETLGQLSEARAVIEQAKGVLMAQRGVDAEQAFEILRDASQRYNRKLREIAQGIVESTRQR